MSRSEISISLEDLVVVIVIKVVVVVELQSRLSGISLSLAQGPVWTYLGLSGTSLSKAQGPICSFLELVVIGLGIVVELGPPLTPPPSSVSSASDCCHLAALTQPDDWLIRPLESGELQLPSSHQTAFAK